MSHLKDDLAYLKWSAGTLLLSLGLGGTLVFVTETYHDNAQARLQSAQRQLNDARTQLSNAQSDRENMAAYAQEYQHLQVQKVIGDEQRLDWMEGLNRLRQQQLVLDFRYTIAPQQAYTPNPPLDAGNLQLNRSAMTLQLDLLHEEQLLRLFAAMRSQMKGWFILDSCTLAPQEREEDNRLTPLRADCSGGWFTMTNRNRP